MKHLNTQFNEPTNQNLVKVPKDFESTNKKTLYKTHACKILNVRLYLPDKTTTHDLSSEGRITESTNCRIIVKNHVQ